MPPDIRPQGEGIRAKAVAWATTKRQEAKALWQLSRRFPSLFVWPCFVLTIILGVGIWAVFYVAENEEKVARERAEILATDAALWFKQQLTVAIAPLLTLSAMVKYNPQYAVVGPLFEGLAPALLKHAQVTSNTIKALQIIPNGVIRLVFPLKGNEGAYNRDLFNSSSGKASAISAIRDGDLGVVGPQDFVQGGYGIVVRMPIFIEDVDESETFGIPAPVNPNCGQPCAYNRTTRTHVWGSVASLIDLDAISASPDSKLLTLASMSYNYEIEASGGLVADGLRTVARSAARPVDPVEAPINLPGVTWMVRVAPKDGWGLDWVAPVLAAVIVLALGTSGLLFAALVSWRRHQVLLEALLPKDVIRNLQVGGGAASLCASIQRVADTPADLLLKMMGELLRGRMPETRDVVFIRTALLRNADVYQPLNLRGRIREANFDTDVMQALMKQLGATGGGFDGHSACSDGDSCALPGLTLPEEDTASTLSRALTNMSTNLSTSQLNYDTLTGALMLLLAPAPQAAVGPAALQLLEASPADGSDALASTCDVASPAVTPPSGANGYHGQSLLSRIASAALPFGRDRDTGSHPKSAAGRLVEVLSASSLRRESSEGLHSANGNCVPSGSFNRGTLAIASGAVARVSAAGTTPTRMMTLGGTASGRGPSGLQPLSLPLGSKQVSSSLVAAIGALAGAAPPMPMAPPLPIIEEVERLLAGADNWRFDAWELAEASGGHALSALAFYLMHREGLISKFRIKPATLARLLRALEAGYISNPYHNATHAADVLQTMHVIIHGAQLHHHYLDRLGLLGAYLAAIVHDHGHPGLTNDFLIGSSDLLAIRYNDRSPLENHHTASCFGIMLQNPDLDALAPLSQTERSTLRKQVIDMVMGTDMKQHFAILGHFSTVHRLSSFSVQAAGRPRGGSVGGAVLATAVTTAAKEGVVIGDAPRPIDDTERMLTLQIALKAADIGHLGEELSVHCKWLGVLEEEFFSQGDRERALGLPISPLFDRNKQGVSKSQVGFYDFVGLPLVHAMSSAFPGAKPLMSCFLANYEHWKVVEARQQQQQHKAEAAAPAASQAAGAVALATGPRSRRASIASASSSKDKLPMLPVGTQPAATVVVVTGPAVQ